MKAICKSAQTLTDQKIGKKCARLYLFAYESLHKFVHATSIPFTHFFALHPDYRD